MAEVAVGAIVAEQVISTSVQAGAAAAAIARPTLPIRANLRHLTIRAPENDKAALTRSHHTLTVIGNNAYIFGGKHADGQLCSPDVHSIALPSEDREVRSQYAHYPAEAANPIGTGSVPLPSSRYAHAAVRREKEVLIHGGKDDQGNDLDDGSVIWAWHSEKAQWRQYAPSDVGSKGPGPQSGHRIFWDEVQDQLVLHSSGGSGSAETWVFTFEKAQWTQAPSTPSPSLSSSLVNGTLYRMCGGNNAKAAIQTLNLRRFPQREVEGVHWSDVSSPSEGGAPDTLGREWTTTLAASTGLGRWYLLNFLGPNTERKEGQRSSSTDIWTLQIPPDHLTGAGIKDVIREKLPNLETGAFQWDELQLPDSPPEARRDFGADCTEDGKSVVVWSGSNSDGKLQSSGWVARIE